MSKSIDSSGNIKHESGGDQHDHRGHSVRGGLAPARQHSQSDLDDVDHGENEEEAAHDGANGGAQHAKP